jgi:hypothetical protein
MELMDSERWRRIVTTIGGLLLAPGTGGYLLTRARVESRVPIDGKTFDRGALVKPIPPSELRPEPTPGPAQSNRRDHDQRGSYPADDFDPLHLPLLCLRGSRQSPGSYPDTGPDGNPIFPGYSQPRSGAALRERTLSQHRSVRHLSSLLVECRQALSLGHAGSRLRDRS